MELLNILKKNSKHFKEPKRCVQLKFERLALVIKTKTSIPV